MPNEEEEERLLCHYSPHPGKVAEGQRDQWQTEGVYEHTVHRQ